MDIDKYIVDFSDSLVKFIPNLIGAIVCLIVGFWIVKKIASLVEFSLKKTNLSLEVISFVSSLVGTGLKIAVALISASFIGFEVASIMTLIAAVGLAVGMALQGNLSNFAAGIAIMVFRPYGLGDWVEISDKFGKVTGIQIFNTVLVTPGRKTIIVPNSQAIEGVVTNFSAEGYIRLELQVSMPYEESFPRVKKIILEALSGVEDILHDPEPMVGIEAYDSHNILVAIKPCIHPDKYWDATFNVYEAIKDAFNKNQIKVAYSEGIELGAIGA